MITPTLVLLALYLWLAYLLHTDGVPTIIIDGKYRTKVSWAGGHNELIDLMNYLAQRAQTERTN